MFLAVFHASQGLTDLSGVLTGTIRSPNFPNSYPPGVMCSWKVVAPVGKRIKVAFNAFHLGECGNKTCSRFLDCDMLEVRDGALNTSKIIGRFCTHRRPPVFYSSRNSLWIDFKSSNRPTNGCFGFKAIFSTENMVLASILPVIGCILLLCVFISVPIIINYRNKRSAALNSSTLSSNTLDDGILLRNETDFLPMKVRSNLENYLSFSEQQEPFIPLLESEEML